MDVPVSASDLSIYLELHETRDFSVRTVPPSAHECRSWHAELNAQEHRLCAL